MAGKHSTSLVTKHVSIMPLPEVLRTASEQFYVAYPESLQPVFRASFASVLDAAGAIAKHNAQARREARRASARKPFLLACLIVEGG